MVKSDERVILMAENYNWALIGCGHIADEMAKAMKQLNKTFYSLTSRTKANADTFAKKYGIDKVYDSIDEVFSDENVNIIYIATPHNSHIEYILKALNAGKHVICEKAITLNSNELQQAVEIAKKKNLVLAEAMTIFHMPVYRKIDEIISSGKLGKLKLVQVNLGSCKDYDMTNRFFNMELAGGAMLDIGVYALSFARYFMTENPVDIESQMKKAPTGADEQVNIILKNTENEMATVTLSLTAKLPKIGIAAYEHGYIEIANYNRAFSASITYTDDGYTEHIETDSDLHALCYEIIDMENAVSDKENNMHLDLTVDVMDIMTKVRYAHNMKYPEELNQ